MFAETPTVYSALTETDPERKCAQVAALTLPLRRNAGEDAQRIPGRPAQPTLVPPNKVPYRGLGTPEGRAALIHAVAHIEFNAVNLALDACWRFSGQPDDFYRDWLSVAQDEARHFLMLSGRLKQLGYSYGDFVAHNGLWEMAEKTAGDVLVRMALVPRVLEARGLDVTPGIIHRFTELRDAETVRILGIILEEEVRHVEIGTRWYRHFCALRGCDPDSTFRALLAEHRMRIRLPLNTAARARAGFNDQELLDAY
ncbi:MAG: ferritin-like domain-containing protein [Rhizobium sp.]|nr:MAG: ferritin-like domain-containing protein [Rhizobium sp.]